MKLFKKTLALCLSTVLLVGILIVPLMHISAAGETETRTINLLDLSGIAAGTELKKDGSTAMPKGLSWGDFDDYDGTRSVVDLGDGKKGLKLAFDKKPSDFTTTTDDFTLKSNPNYGIKVEIPEAYRKYVTGFSFKIYNDVSDPGNWDFWKSYHLLGFTDGTNYAKNTDGPQMFGNKGDQEFNFSITDKYKVSGTQYCDKTHPYWNGNNLWTASENSKITHVTADFVLPYDNCGTTQHLLVKEVNIVVSGTPEELDKAADDAKNENNKPDEPVDTSVLINDFESDSNNSNVVSAADEGVFAASGEKVFRYHRDDSYGGSGYTKVIDLDSKVSKYDGISFYLYNPNNETPRIRCYLRSGGTHIAHKDFTASKADDYIKYTIWFDDVGETIADWWVGDSCTGKSLTAVEIASLNDICINIQGGAGVTYYFDDFCYEKRNSKPVKEKKLDLTKAEVWTDNGYTDTETPNPTTEGITYSVDGTRSDQTWQGWKTVIDVSDGTMINASGLKITAKYNSTGTDKLRIGANLYGTDDNGNEQYWSWGENPDSIWPSGYANTEVTKTLKYSEKLYESTEWGTHGTGLSDTGYPTGSENAKLKEIQIYVWAPADAETGDSVTISDISVIYGGSKVSLADGVQNGNISVGDNGYTYLNDHTVQSAGYFFAGEKAVINIIPDAGYALKPDSLKFTDSTGKEIKIKREGFRKLNCTSYTFTMPTADVTVSAEFAPEAEVIGTVYGNVSADIDNTKLKFDYTVPLKKGKVMVDGSEYTPVGYGAVVTTAEVSNNYSAIFDSANGHFIGGLSTNVYINKTNGYYYDNCVSLVRYNVVIEVPENMKDTEFVVFPYIEYDDGNGNIIHKGSQKILAKFTEKAFGMTEFAATATYAKGVNMGGLFDNTNADASALRNSVYVLPETYAGIKTAGFDHVRLPITFGSHLEEDGTINADYLAEVDNAVKAAISNGLTAVIDLHHYGDLMQNVSANKDNFYSIWEQLANHYKNYPDRVIFELLNEPSNHEGADSMDADELNTIQLAAVAKIREIDSDRIIALAVFGNNTASGLQNLELPTDTSNLIVSVHNYEPYTFTHQGLDPNCPSGVDYSTSDKTLFNSNVETAKAFSTNHNNIPIWMSEFGVYLGALGQGDFSEEDVTAYYTDFINSCNANGFSWCVWDYNMGFGIFEANNELKSFVKAGLFPQ